jgi:hypothetical protein
MRFLTLLIPILGAGSALAHHMATNIWIDGGMYLECYRQTLQKLTRLAVNQGAGTCMRIPRNTDPVTNVYSEDMACNVGRNKQEAITCAANGMSFDLPILNLLLMLNSRISSHSSVAYLARRI